MISVNTYDVLECNLKAEIFREMEGLLIIC